MRTTTEAGKLAEDAACTYLINDGYKIIKQNWRTRWCEIDIVAKKNNMMYFCEVKYRKNADWGDGLDAITIKKQQQMVFATELWVQNNNWAGDYMILVISTNGTPPVVDQCLEMN